MPRTPNATGTPKVEANASQDAIDDLRIQRDLLRKRLRSKDISSRDLATVSAELRKVDYTLAQVEGASRSGGIAEEELAARAEKVRERIMKTLAERKKVRALSLVAAPTTEEAKLTGT